MNPLLKVAITAVRDAGKEILALYTTTDFEKKLDGSPVTVADTRSNEILLEHLKTTGIPILSEESDGILYSTGDKVTYPPQLWIIDPLDGTKDFLKKKRLFLSNDWSP